MAKPAMQLNRSHKSSSYYARASDVALHSQSIQKRNILYTIPTTHKIKIKSCSDVALFFNRKSIRDFCHEHTFCAINPFIYRHLNTSHVPSLLNSDWEVLFTEPQGYFSWWSQVFSIYIAFTYSPSALLTQHREAAEPLIEVGVKSSPWAWHRKPDLQFIPSVVTASCVWTIKDCWPSSWYILYSLPVWHLYKCFNNMFLFLLFIRNVSSPWSN